jgi:hypothetical protein
MTEESVRGHHGEPDPSGHGGEPDRGSRVGRELPGCRELSRRTGVV